jgi:hypothetical protein
MDVPQFADLSGQVSTGAIYVINGFDNWDAFIGRLRDYATHANIRPSPAAAASTLDPEDLVWIYQPNLERHQTGRLVAAFPCTIHRHKYHTLDQCVALKLSVNVTPSRIHHPVALRSAIEVRTTVDAMAEDVAEVAITIKNPLIPMLPLPPPRPQPKAHLPAL